MTAYGDVRMLGNPRAGTGPRAGSHPRPADALGTLRAAVRTRPAASVRPARLTDRRRAVQPAAPPAVVPEPKAQPQRVRRVLRSPARAGRRPHPIGRVLALVLVSFMVGLVYLAQTVHIAATNYEVDQLVAQRDDLTRQVQTIEAALVQLNTEPIVVERAQRLGLDTLTGRVRIASR